MSLDGHRAVSPQPTPPAAVPRPTGAIPAQQGAEFDLVGWVGAPRHREPAGVFGLGPEPRASDEKTLADDAIPGWKLLLRAALNALVAYEALIYSGDLVTWFFQLFFHGVLAAVTRGDLLATLFAYLLNALIVVLLIWVFGRWGRWKLVWRRYGRPVLARLREARQARPQSGVTVEAPPDVWAPLRPYAHTGALGQLDAETRARRVGDVDHQRLVRAAEVVRHDPDRLGALLEAVREHGAAACGHPSGARDLPGRGPWHDLLLRQFRIGTAEDVPKNPAGYRGADIALDPALLGTSLLAVGPSGSGKTSRLTRPAAEALCLQALTGTAVVAVVGAADADLGPASWYDVVVAPGDPHAAYGLDLFGGARQLDEAAARLADALLPDELALRAESARLALQQIVGPFQAGYGRLPGVRELVLLLRAEPTAWSALLKAVRESGELDRHQHELAQRERMHGLADDPGALLADRLALLDRPVFARCFNASAGDPEPLPLFALRALDHPLRVRIALPEHNYPEAARILGRLAVGQFLHAAASRADRSLFAGLVVDDASAAVDSHTVRALQRLRAANAGAVLGLRTLVDLPEQLRTPLFGAVGGRMAFPGIAPWDGKLFEDAWGTVWVDERDVTRALDTSGGLLRRGLRGMRALLVGERAQTESVTTRRVERRRWSASDLAQVLPHGHAVVSLTSVDGTQVPPLLVRLQ
ncbi:hypothetical protein [Streptacidiphilus rugosus]|uniref:hypothetical protein n=1 Tax=Streptacidiphilus rugosus TaxID=405783 RepID=UPI0005613649|nr:hypothetical protein [Streptacidiphilus rugosus]